jgi:hypothetical protein
MPLIAFCYDGLLLEVVVGCRLVMQLPCGLMPLQMPCHYLRSACPTMLSKITVHHCE